MPCRCRLGVWLPSDQAARSDPVAAWLETGATAGEHLSSGLPAVTSPLAEEEKVFVIGIDPHRGSHTATVLDDKEVVVDELHLVADRRQIDRLLSFAVP